LINIVESYCQRFGKKKKSVDAHKPLSEREKFVAAFGMAGRSSHLVSVCKLIERYAPKDQTVLITGESGTGKEVVAQSIHQHSRFKKGPFVSVNCGAINENLIESELFGHQKGSFTGAVKDKAGYFARANNGSIFLDEIGDMPLSTQVKLLRVLQSGEITPVGASSPLKIKVRIIAATNVNLEKAIKQRQFREDLYYRLNVLPIALLPLRQRTEDIEPLLREFLKIWKDKTGEEKKFRAEAVTALEGYGWPGNVRQLENTVSRLLAGVGVGDIEYVDLESEFKRSEERQEIASLVDSYQTMKAEIANREREILVEIVRSTGSLSKAAKALQIGKTTLYDKLKSFGAQQNIKEEK
jgi:transcriptional regulator with PAS, ATPase and Fis domain